MVLPDCLSEDVLMAAVQESMFGMGSAGFCMRCGQEQSGCEPDAREYECESCGENAVYGAQEILLECFA